MNLGLKMTISVAISGAFFTPSKSKLLAALGSMP